MASMFLPALAVALVLSGPSCLMGATVSAVSTTVASEAIFAVSVRVDSVSDLYAYQFDLAFDAGVLELQSILEGPFLPSTGGATLFVPGVIDNVLGTTTLTASTLIGVTSGASGNGDLAVFVFRPIAFAESPLALSNVVLLDSALSEIATDIVNGQVTVVPEPSALVGVSIALATFAVVVARWRLRGRC